LQWSDEVVGYCAFGTSSEQQQTLWFVQTVFDPVEQLADGLAAADGTVVGDYLRPCGYIYSSTGYS
jgi:hypothetical protein